MSDDFDPKKYIKGDYDKGESFDPHAYLSGKYDEPKFTEVESGLLGAAQGGTMGFADEMEGAAKALFTNKTYHEGRDEARSRYQKAEDQNPKSFLVGQVGGGIATSLIPGVGIAKGAGLAAGAAKAALIGGVAGAGYSKTDPTKSPDDLKHFAGDVGEGAAFGGVTQGALGAAGKYLPSKSADLLDYLAQRRAVKAATGQNKKVIKEAIKGGRLQKMGQDLLATDESGGPAIGYLDKTESIAPKLESKQKFFGGKIGEVSNQIDTQMPKAVSGQEVANSIIEEASKIPELPHTKGIIDRMQETAAKFEQMGDMNFADAQKYKNQFKLTASDHTQEINNKVANNNMYKAVKNAMEKSASRISDVSDDQNLKDLLGRYKEYKGKYATFKTLSDAAKDREAANLANRFVSPSDYGTGLMTAGATMMSHGNLTPALAVGALAAGGNKLARTYGSSLAARSLDKVADILRASPEALGKYAGPLKDALDRGGASFALTHQLLMAKDPGYQQLIQGGEGQ